MDINQQGPTSPEEYETERLAAKFAMTNDELNTAIKTAAQFAGYEFNCEPRTTMFRKHLEALLAIQYARAGVVRVSVEKVGAAETAHNAEITGRR